MPNSIIHRLRDGRRLGYAEYGDPLGTPIVYAHGGLSSRLDIAFASERCRTAGVRLLAPDRPGIGLSDPQSGRSLLDWPGDVAQLADAIGLECFAVLGWSAGGAYALACAHRLGQRITAVGIVAGMAPLERAEMIGELGMRADRLLFSLAGRAPAVAALGLGVAGRLPRKVIRAALRRDLRSDSDREIIAAASLAESTDFFLEAFRQGPRGIVEDYRVTGGPWGFRPEEIRADVFLWHGAEDNLLPLRHARALAARLPNARLDVLPDRGHFLLHRELPRALDALAGRRSA